MNLLVLLFSLAVAPPTAAPEAPVIASAMVETNSVLLCWTVQGTNAGGPDTNGRFEIERSMTNTTSHSFASYKLGQPVTYVAATQITRYAWRDTQALTSPTTYKVRSFSFATGDPSRWSNPVTITNARPVAPLLRLIEVPPPLPGQLQTLSYRMMISTNLIHWDEILRTIDAQGPGCFINYCPLGSTSTFYRIKPL